MNPDLPLDVGGSGREYRGQNPGSAVEAELRRLEDQFHAAILEGSSKGAPLHRQEVQRASSVLTNLAFDYQFSSTQLVTVTSWLEALDPSDPKQISHFVDLVTKFVELKMPADSWTALYAVARRMKGGDRPLEAGFAEGVLELGQATYDRPMMQRLFAFVDKALQAPPEMRERFGRFVSLSGAISSVDHTQEAQRETLMLRVSLVRRAVERGWGERLFERVVELFPETPTVLGQSARVVALVDRNGSSDWIKNELSWIRDWEAAEGFATKDDENALHIILNSTSRKELIVAVQQTRSVGDLKILLRLVREAGGEGERALGMLANRLAERREPIGITLRAIDRFTERGIPFVRVTALGADSLLRSYFEGRAYLAEVRAPEREMDRLVDALLAYNERCERSEKRVTYRDLDDQLKRIVTTGPRTLLLGDAQLRQKLILCLSGRGLSDDKALSSKKNFDWLLRDVHANGILLKWLSSPPGVGRRASLKRFVKTFKGDNPPFSIEGPNPEPAEVQMKFQGQIFRVMSQQVDGYLGAWANTFSFRHTPIGERCLFDEMASGLDANLSVIPADDIGRFPGRGRVVTNLDIDAIFPGDAKVVEDPQHLWKNGPFAEYGPVEDARVSAGNVHALENLRHARLTALRGMFAYGVPDNPFMEIEGENMTYVEWNHHFDASGVRMASLVPTRALHSFIDPVMVPYDPREDDFPFDAARDITKHPPTFEALARRARKLKCGVGVINLSAGSAVSGGFCNSFEWGSPPFRRWESVPDNRTYRDMFGFSHKWHIQRQKHIETKLWDAHVRVYEVATALQRMRDMVKFTMGRDARGETRRATGLTNGAGEFLGSRYGYRGENPERLRMLELFSEFAAESRERGIPKQQIPNLVLAPMNWWSRAVDASSTPFVIDGYTGVVFQKAEWGKPMMADLEGGVPCSELVEWWEESVDPFLDQNEWVAPRLVAREKTIALMQEYGFKV